MKEAAVVIDDDDVVMVEPTEMINNNKNQESTTEDTIIIDEELTPPSPSNSKRGKTPTLHTDTEIITDTDKEASFIKLLKNNTLMNKIINRCQKVENNHGVLRVINKILLPLYEELDNKIKESDSITEVLNKILSNLKYDPVHKFLHIKTLCEELKARTLRKKVPLITIAQNVKKNRRHCSQRKKIKEHVKKSVKRRKYKQRKQVDVIDLDQSEESDEAIATLEVDDDDSDKDEIMFVEETNNDNASELSNKENSETNKNNENEINGSNETDKENSDIELVESSEEIKQVAVTEDNKTENYSVDDLLVPRNCVTDEEIRNEEIRSIEEMIKNNKKKILELEEQEVPSDDEESPYILCDKYKANIVTLYRRLCKLTGSDDVDITKRRTVRLHVLDGHPPGPVKRLEKFLNSTIDETGMVPMPDFHDVVRCVTQSNSLDKLNWSQNEIMREAIALFTHCGQALRTKRQKREYKDLMSLVKNKDVDDYDPANEDPLLHRRLEENKLIAKANENEIINRYTTMEYQRKPKLLTARLARARQLIEDAISSDSESDSDLTPQKKAKTKDCVPNARESLENIDCIPNTSPQSTDNHNVHSNLGSTSIQNITNTGRNPVANRQNVHIYTDLGTLKKIGASNIYVMDINSDIQDTSDILVNIEVNMSETNVPDKDIERNESNKSISESNVLEIKEASAELEHISVKVEPPDIEGSMNISDSNVLENKEPNTEFERISFKVEPPELEGSMNICDSNVLENKEPSTEFERISFKVEPPDIEGSMNICDSNVLENKELSTEIERISFKVEPPDIEGSMNFSNSNVLENKKSNTEFGRIIFEVEPPELEGLEGIENISESNVLENREPSTELENISVKVEPPDIESKSNQNISDSNDLESRESNTDLDSVKVLPLDKKGSHMNNSEHSDKKNTSLETQIKKEPQPLDIQRLLNELGDNYISTIFDIEDPFVVIEISDSSDDEL